MSTTRAEVMPAIGRSWAYLALTKPDVTFLVMITTVAGFCLAAPGPIEWLRLANTLLATTFVAAGTAALNQYFERDSDARMRRTASRPLPLGQLLPAEAFRFGTALILVGAAYLVSCTNLLACLLALATSLFYLGAYTPLKKRTTLATAVGACPGALPPLIGWAAATGSLSLGAWVLFAILFFWQFPHFMAIAWMYREDYSRAGIKMLPVVDPSGDATFSQIVGSAALLMIVSLLPSVAGLASVRYFFSAVLIGMAFLQICLWANRSRTNVRAKWLMHATVIHIPVLLSLMLFDKFSR
jgi:heme o synthase